MAVKIRLKRTGSRNDACYRVVAADTRSPRDGRNLENLGWYTPTQPGVNFKLKLERIDHWIGNGAQVSDTVASLIRKARKLETSAPVEEKVEEKAAEVATEEVAEAPVEVAAEAPASA
jgi:small subunit ribosomal protein S16